MHRSGTSLVARLLSLLGIALGDSGDLSAPAADNPTGFWENARFVRVNEDILSILGAGWDLPPTGNVNWTTDGPLAGCHAEAERIREAFSGNRAWGWKDPRTSLTLPFWLEQLPTLRVVVCVRNPLDVARSLHARNHLSYALGLRLWLEYNQRILETTRPDQRLVTHYDSHFRDPDAALTRLRGFVDRSIDAAGWRAAVATARQDLRHSASVTADLIAAGLGEPLIALYRQLCREAEYDDRESGCNASDWSGAATFFRITSDAELAGTTQPGRDADERVVSLALPLHEARYAVDSLRRQVAERDERLAAGERTIRELQDQLTESQAARTVASIEAAERAREIEAIKSSTGWQLLVVLWRLRVRLVPLGSQRDHALWKVLCTCRSWMDRLPRRRGLPADGEGTGQSAKRAAKLVAVDNLDPAWTATAPTTYDIVILPIIDWDFRFQRPQQLARQCARAGHRVFYVATTFRGGNRVAIRQIEVGIFEVQLPGPAQTTIYQDFLDPDLISQLVEALGGIRAAFSMSDAVCLINLPSWADLAVTLRERFGWKIVYDCLDEHGGFSALSSSLLDREPTLCRSSDLVVTSSRVLYAKHAASNANTILVPNAADFDHFHQPQGEPPDEIRSLPKPVIGYFGAIAEWFDTRLVAQLAAGEPDWTFVLIGSTAGADLAPIQGLPNVRLLGEKAYSSLPDYLQGFDVCIVPFRVLPLTHATNPVKMFEYLSAGKPVVATALEELNHYQGQITLASTLAEWQRGLVQALCDDDPAHVAGRIEFARANTWTRRGNDLLEQIDRLYPLVSIIIVTYNNLQYTQLCIDSLREKTAYPNVEVIIVDNNSFDGTREYLRELSRADERIRIILNDANTGFAAANNAGIASARGEYICLLNNDTIVTPGWLSRLVHHLTDPIVGLVGPVTSFAGNESRINVPYQSPAEIDEFARRYTLEHFGETFEIGMLAMFCVVMRRSLLDEIGLLDTRFGIGMFEDDDFSMRVRERGYRVLCAEDVFVHHWGKVSFSQMDEAEYQRLFEVNKRQFEEKWGQAWQPHRARRTR